MIEIPDGIITPDDPEGFLFDYISTHYFGYLLKQGEYIYISFIDTYPNGVGLLSLLFKKIEAAGYKVKVPCPLGHMEEILIAKGFICTTEINEIYGEPVDVWMRKE